MNYQNLLIGVLIVILVGLAAVIAWRFNQVSPLRLSVGVDLTPALRNPAEMRLEPSPEDPEVVWHEGQLYTFQLQANSEVITVRVDQPEKVLVLAGYVHPPERVCTDGALAPVHERQYRRGDQVAIYACAPPIAGSEARITLLDGATPGDVYAVAVAAGVPVGPIMPPFTPRPAPTPTATPHPNRLPAKPWGINAVYHGGDNEAISLSWARPPVDAAEATSVNPPGVIPTGYRVERRECRSYKGGDYETTEIDPGTNLPVDVTITLAVPGPPDSSLCGDGVATELDPSAPADFNPEWAPWGTVYDDPASSVTYTVDAHHLPPMANDSYSLRLQYRVAAYAGDSLAGPYSDEPHGEATVDRQITN